MIFLDANPLIALVDKLWTYDSEFRVVWRRPDGSRIPMAVPERRSL
jgi:hypothetical protein